MAERTVREKIEEIFGPAQPDRDVGAADPSVEVFSVVYGGVARRIRARRADGGVISAEVEPRTDD